MVRTSSFGPPKAYAALILVSPCPGTSTIESRGIDISRSGPDPVCSSMIVSVRCPTSPPVPSSLRSSSVRSSRESLPTRRYVVPSCSGGRSPLGEASTLSTLLQAQSGTTIRNTSQARSTHLTHPRRKRGRERLGRPGGGGGPGVRGGAVGGAGGAVLPEPRGTTGITRVWSGRGVPTWGTTRVWSPGVGFPPWP